MSSKNKAGKITADQLTDAMRATTSYKMLCEHLDDACFARLERTGAITLSKLGRELILMHLWFALEHEDWVKRKQKVYQAHLSKAAALAASLASTLLADERLSDEHAGLIRSCNGLMRANQRAAKWWPNRVGRKDDSHVDDLLINLAEEYRRAGGRTTVGGGNYTRFLGSLWEELPSEFRRRLTSSRNRFTARAAALVTTIRALEQAARRPTPTQKLVNSRPN